MSEGERTFKRRAVRPMQCLRDGWQLIKDDYWLFLGITVIGILVGSLVPFGLLMGPIMCGIYLCLFRKEDGRRVTFDMLFKGFDYFAQSLIAMLIMLVPTLLLVGLLYGGFFVGLFALLGTISSQQPNGGQLDPAAIWGFAALYGGLVLGIMVISLLIGMLFLFTFPLIVDRKLTGVEAVRLSIRAALSNLGGLLGLMLIQFLLNMVGMLACYVGAFFVVPLGVAMNMMAYRQVFPLDGSLLFAAPPPGWDEPIETAGPDRSGIRRSPADPRTVPERSNESGIRQSGPAAGDE